MTRAESKRIKILYVDYDHREPGGNRVARTVGSISIPQASLPEWRKAAERRGDTVTAIPALNQIIVDVTKPKAE